ncbi:RecB family exonuclease, partial [Candidatus Bipolaricaulota bacterium]
AIHQAIRIFQLNRIAEQETPLRELHDVFRKAWQAEGFLTREHEEMRLQQGLKALTAFHAAETASESIPTYVEKRFSITLDDVRLVGIFDRIDIVDGNGTIIDYKTSDIRTEEQAVRRAKGSRQLALYSLAYRQLFGGLPNALELRFLTPDVVIGHTVPTEKMLDKALQEMETACAGIRSGEFPGEPQYRACEYCPYSGICPDRKMV